ncbi:MAG: hypothetical protein AB1507_01490 [Bacillota bacterium]|jgi:hypothetical protein|nr:hypothetical protein [Thermoanaerobacteraceae bacterium]
MLLPTDIVIALRCPDCGRLELFHLSRFAVSKQKPGRVICSCGMEKAVVSTKDHTAYTFDVSCTVCDLHHTYRLSGKKLWSSELTTLLCLETGLELGNVGPRDKVRATIQTYQEELESLIEELGGPSYFSNPDVMFEVLNYLQEMADEGSVFCPCGKNKIELEVLPDRLELRCKNCDRMTTIYAETEEDFLQLQEFPAIELSRRSFYGFDRAVRGKKKGIKRDNK